MSERRIKPTKPAKPELSVELKQLIADTIRETLRETMRDNPGPSDGGWGDHEDEDDDMDYQPPQTIAFQASTLEQLTYNINEWVQDTESDIVNMALLSSSAGEGQTNYEALILFYTSESEPPPGWLNGA